MDKVAQSVTMSSSVAKVKPLFSIVVPAYNVGEYLEEAVESIVQQDIGFSENVEVIIVDDGSTDDSGMIADRIAKTYPSNIHVVHQENQGVSVARNNGMALAKGTFVGFLDPDDKYSTQTFRNVKRFFEEHGDEIDVVGIPIVYFEARTGQHQLNNKFKDGTRVIDVNKDWQFHQGAVMSAFIRKSAIEEYGVKLDPNLKYAEDGKFMTQIIMRKKKFGVVAEAQLNYRKRLFGDSALDSGESRKDYYLPVMEHFAAALFDEFQDQEGKVPRYVQQIVCYDLQWRIKQRNQTVLNEVEQDKYVRSIQRVLSKIDYEVIQKQKHIYIDHKLYMMGLKRGAPVLPDLRLKGNSVMLDGHRVWGAYADAYDCGVHSIYLEGDQLKLRGIFKGLPIKGVEIGFVKGKDFYPVDRCAVPLNKQPLFLGDPVLEPIGFSFTTSIHPGERIRPAVKIGGEVHSTRFKFEKNSRIPNSHTSYLILDSLLLQNVANRYLAVKKVSVFEVFKREVAFLNQLLRGSLGRTVEKRKPTLVFYRMASLIGRKLKRKPIWVVSDRLTEAGDNGEALFRHLVDSDLKKTHKFVYLLTKDSPDYKSLKKIGSVADPRSVSGLLTILRADILAGSHIDDHVVNPFGKDWKFVSDLYRFKVVFLQHGVTLHDISNWLNVFDKPIRRFITTGEPEHNSLVGNKYGFDEDEVVITGFARHDRLDRAKTKKKIVVAPTWRKSLAGQMDPETMERAYNPEFSESEYFKFFNALINDSRLIETLKRTGYSLDFVIHPALSKQIQDFNASGPVHIVEPPYIYRDIISEAAMFITDFSSVVSDAAYLRKRIAYAQFDSILTGDHIVRQGYFEYERDGFGPILHSVDGLVTEIINAIGQDCLVDSKYLDRMNRFFAFDDAENCSRIVRELNQL